ncbi:MAG: NADH-quinone oxidoreductase subunit F [Puniceicoccaceae bacterium]
MSNSGKLSFGSINPGSGLKLALQQSRRDVLTQMEEAGLKGRGGAGFPVGLKWRLCAGEENFPKYVICNADEGEPGTFKDRVILNRYPEQVFLGMAICAYAVGSRHGIVYLRGEYAYLMKRLKKSLLDLRQANLLGETILGMEGFDFDIRIHLGSGAYVCGEESALIESLEGYRGVPRNRPPYPVARGYLNKPSVVNNVETFAWCTSILSLGSGWFRSLGTEQSTGLKLFSISGDCTSPGVYEFPMGISIAELIEAAGGQNAKAVQVGGASGHCVPARDFSRSIAFEDVPTGGSVIVFGPERDMLDVAENFLEFFCDESCGQCTPCRIGNVKLLEGVRLLKEGRCAMNYLEELVRLGESMQVAAKCGLGQTSANAFLSIVKNFKDEILGRIPA